MGYMCRSSPSPGVGVHVPGTLLHAPHCNARAVVYSMPLLFPVVIGFPFVHTTAPRCHDNVHAPQRSLTPGDDPDCANFKMCHLFTQFVCGCVRYVLILLHVRGLPVPCHHKTVDIAWTRHHRGFKLGAIRFPSSEPRNTHNRSSNRATRQPSHPKRQWTGQGQGPKRQSVKGSTSPQEHEDTPNQHSPNLISACPAWQKNRSAAPHCEQRHARGPVHGRTGQHLAIRVVVGEAGPLCTSPRRHASCNIPNT